MNIPTYDESINADNPLAKFIRCHEPAGYEDTKNFRMSLSKALAYVVQETQARLTLTEAALSAAVELLGVSMADSYGREGEMIWCFYCGMFEEHTETCPYHQSKKQWDAAREALRGVNK